MRNQGGDIIAIKGRTHKARKEGEGLTLSDKCAVCNIRPRETGSVLCGLQTCLVEWQRAYDAARKDRGEGI